MLLESIIPRVTLAGNPGEGAQSLDKPARAPHRWEFLHELIFTTSGKNGYASVEGLFNQMAAEVPAFQGVTWSALGDLGTSIPI